MVQVYVSCPQKKLVKEFRRLSAFAKTGGTAFAVRELEVRNPLGRFVPVSVLNELRRALLEKCGEMDGACGMRLPRRDASHNDLQSEENIGIRSHLFQ